MKKMNRILSVILTVTMLVTMLPAAAFAVETDGKYETESAEEAGAAFGQETDNGTTVEKIPDKETGNEADEVRNTVDSESMNGGSEELEAEDDDHAEEPSEAADNAIENDDADASEVNKVTTLEAEGKDYVVTITYGDDAELPPDAEIRVEEVKAEDDPDIYDSYVAQAAEAVNSEVKDLSYVKLLDISIVDENEQKVDLKDNVDVQIRLKDVEEAEDTTQVVHFAGEEEVPEVMETEVDGDTVAFETEGFSVYAVVNPDEKYQRLVVEFYAKPYYVTEGNDVWKTMYVKKADTTVDAEFNKIIYDPGIPADPENPTNEFAGWFRKDTESDPEPGADTQYKYIDGIRNEIKSVLNNGGIVDGETTIRYYPAKAFRLFYEDETGEIFYTETCKTGGTSATADITAGYPTPKKPGEVFLYWKDKEADPTQDVIKYKNEEGFERSITLTEDVTLVPVLSLGYKVVYHSNDNNPEKGGASFTPTRYYANTEYPVRPTNPTMPGYSFTGWFDKPGEDGTEFRFRGEEGAVLPTGDLNLYAHWTPAAADYKVIVKIQDVDNAVNASNKTYTFAGGFTVKADTNTNTGIELITGKTIEQIENEPGDFLKALKNDSRVTQFTTVQDIDDSSKAYKDPYYEVNYGTNDGTVSPAGDTVITLYYDREVWTMYYLREMEATKDNAETGLYYQVYTAGYQLAYYYELTGTKNGGQWDYTYKDRNGTTHNLKNWKNGIKYRPVIAQENGEDKKAQGLYGQQLTWPAPTVVNGDELTKPIVHDENNLNTDNISYYHLLGTAENPQVNSFTGKLFKNNQISIYEQYRINLIVYFYNENTDGTFEDPVTIASRYRHDYSEIAISGFFEGLVPSQYMFHDRGGAGNKAYYPPKRGADLPEKGWTNVTVESDGSIKSLEPSFIHEENEYYLLIKNTRVRNKLIFKYPDSDGSWKVLKTVGVDTQGNDKIEDQVRYQEPLISKEGLFPKLDEINAVADAGGFYFEGSGNQNYGTNHQYPGWYLDPACTEPADFNKGMGLSDVTLYAKMEPGQFHVRVFWNDGENKESNFRTRRSGEKLDPTSSTFTRVNKDGYSLVAYYTDPSCEEQYRWDWNSPVNAKTATHVFEGKNDTARNGYPLGKVFPEYSEVGVETTVGVLTLYAYWYEDGGFIVEYDNPTGGRDISYLNSGHIYGDKAVVSIADPPKEEDWIKDDNNNLMQFTGWKLKNRTNILKPGDTFQADSDLADAEKRHDPETGKDLYVIKVTAQYDAAQDRTPTHINWYYNYEGAPRKYFFQHKELGINQAVEVPKEYDEENELIIPKRLGYKFLGWAKGPENDEDGLLTVTKDDLIIRYNKDTQTYDIDRVAADEAKSGSGADYEAFYAVYERSTFKILHSALPENDENRIEKVPVPLTKNGTFDITAKVTEDYMYGGYYDCINNEQGTFINEYPGTEMHPEEDKTYYLKEVDPNYLKPQLYVVYSKATGVMSSMYGLVNIDSADIDTDEDYIQGDYTECGLLVRKTAGKDGKPEEFEPFMAEGDVAKTIQVKKNGADYGNPLSRSNFGDAFVKDKLKDAECYIGYARIDQSVENDGMSYIAPGAELEIKAYYVTRDGIRVEGAKSRMITFEGVAGSTNPVIFSGWKSANPNGTRSGIVGSEPKYVSVYGECGDDDGKGVHGTPTTDLDVTVGYTVKMYNLPNETGKGTQTVYGGNNTGKIIAPEKEGYLFAGWFTDEKLMEPADFSYVDKDMEVYASYIPRKDVTLSLARKTGKTGKVTFTATVSIKNTNKFTEVGVICGHNEIETKGELTKKTYLNTGTTKNPRYTYKFSGPVEVNDLTLSDEFTASVYWVTKDGTKVTEDARSCTYSSGSVRVQK